jgi:hypothetical protein
MYTKTRSREILLSMVLSCSLLIASAPMTSAITTSAIGVTGSLYCPQLTTILKRGATNATTGGQVTALQQFLSDYYHLNPQVLAGGFFGSITQRYVMRLQTEQHLPSYGIVGTLTRATIARLCHAVEPLPPTTSPSGTPTTTTSRKISSFDGVTVGANVNITWASTTNHCSLYRYTSLGPTDGAYDPGSKILVVANLAPSGTYTTPYIGTMGNWQAPGYEQYTLQCDDVVSNISVAGASKI